MKQHIFILFFILSTSYSLAIRPCEEVFAIKQNLSKESLKKRNLERTDLQEMTLEEIDLRGANLKWVNFQGAKLRGSDLSHADLRGANLQLVDLREVGLVNSDLRGTILIGVDLRGTDLSTAKLGAFGKRYFQGNVGYLQKTNLKLAKYNSKTKFPKGFDPEDHGMIFSK